MTLMLATLRSKIKFSYFWLYIEYTAVTLINCRVLPKVVPYKSCTLHRVINTPNFHIVYLFFPKTKKTSHLRGPPESKMPYFFTITGDKFVFYVPIRRYGDFNTLQQPVHPLAAPQGVLGYFRVLKSPYLRIGT